EAEAAGAAGLTVGGDLGPGDGAELAERLEEVVRGGLERQVPDIDVLAHDLPSGACWPLKRATRRANGADASSHDGNTAGRHCPATRLGLLGSCEAKEALSR